MQKHILQAISTVYRGPTDTRGSRIVATSASGLRVVVPWNYELSAVDNHQYAALSLAKKLGWQGTWICGVTKQGYCFVRNPE